MTAPHISSMSDQWPGLAAFESSNQVVRCAARRVRRGERQLGGCSQQHDRGVVVAPWQWRVGVSTELDDGHGQFEVVWSNRVNLQGRQRAVELAHADDRKNMVGLQSMVQL